MYAPLCSPRAPWPAPGQGRFAFVFLAFALDRARRGGRPRRETAWCGSCACAEVQGGRSSLRRPGRSGIMECLLPVSALRNAIYSTMTDRHRMDRRVSMPSPATSQAARSCGASTNEAVQETQWPKFSCEPWPPTGEERAPLKKKTAGFWFQDLNTAITR